jgi:hypothetical protein
VESVPPGTVVEARRFVIFLDFSQLTFGGRIRALDHASQWVHETMAVGDETMIAAFASGTGLEELHPFTSDKVRLLSTLERTKTDRAFIDPFPELIEARVRECEGTPPLCDPLATEEYFHGRRSLRAMKRLMSRLEEIPGRKSLLLFHENGFMDPGSVYHADSALHLQSAEEVAAAATLARTTIHAVYEGTMPADIGLDPFGMDREREALTLSSNLADFTGGTYARGSMDAPAFLREAGRGCRCLYRIGLVPPPVPSRRVYTVRVTAGGVPLRSALRVQFLSEADRWMRKAQVVLEDPSRARDIPVAVSIVPAAVSGSRWDVKVQVALHTDSLALLPEETGRGGEWETGALLHRLDAEKSWEMLGVYRVRRGIEGESAVPVVHEKLITDLKPGPYRLAAFVRDRTANVFGAAETTIDLPDPGDGGAAGPVLMLASRPRLDVPLPLYTERLADKVTSASRGSSSIPARADPIPRGTAIEALTWICPGKKAPPAVKAVTFLSRLGRRAFSTGSHVLEDGETCRRFTDRFETEPLEDGGYVYFVEWSRPAGGPGTVEAPLEIGPVQVVSK